MGIAEEMKKAGYEYDPDYRGWYKKDVKELFKGKWIKPRKRFFIPPFGITDEELHKRIKDKEVSNEKDKDKN